MYTREILPPVNSPVENGVPLQGTWDRAFGGVDMLDVRRPYQFPLPGWAKNLRVKEWESVYTQNERFFFGFLLGNAKLYRVARLVLFDKEKGEKFLFNRLIPGSGWGLPGNSWRLPRSLANSSVYGRSRRYFFRIHSWLDADTIKLAVNIEKSRRQPALTAHIEYNLSKSDVTPMAVSLVFSGQRSMYAFKAMAVARGDIILGDRRIRLNPAETSGIFCDYKGFFPYRMRGTFCNASGFTGEGRRYGFHLGENQAKETNRNNENALWVNGCLTPLPPVRVTMPRGIDSDWTIQDVEGMVDLVFTPKEHINSSARAVITSAELNTPLGHYNGMLVSADGEQIQVRNLWGLGAHLYLRV
ncbi:MAG TPA: DUF2804 domain-containing protein [Treponema sp.]|nr:DUF2804 domain-containing protein [Treponema sp.]